MRFTASGSVEGEPFVEVQFTAAEIAALASYIWWQHDGVMCGDIADQPADEFVILAATGGYFNETQAKLDWFERNLERQRTRNHGRE